MLSRGKLVVVGGHSRRVGKTSMMAAIQRCTPEIDWHAVKISNHRHAGQPSGAPGLLRLTDNEFARGIAPLERMREEGRHVLVESNRIAAHLTPDLVIFVVDPLNPDWKASSATCLERAAALVFSQDGPFPAQLCVLDRIVPVFRLTAWNQTPLGFAEWIAERLAEKEVLPDETPLVAASRRRVCLCAGSRGSHTDQVGQHLDPRFSAFTPGGLGLVPA